MSLQAEGVTAGYARDVPIISDVSLIAKEGCTTTIIGPNGAGKSTLLKTLCGLLPTMRGKIMFNGLEITKMSTREILRLGISYIPQDNFIFPKLTVEENIKIAAKIIKLRNYVIEERLSDVLQHFPDLRDKLRRQAGDLSGGQQKMIAIARSMIVNSRLLMFDEPTAGLSPSSALKLYRKIRELREMGKTIILVEQNVREALAVSDYAYVLNLGKVTHQGEAEEIATSLDSIVKSWLRAR
ncbi:MAG: ABC transporter ATP-binding protein [Nitrososphaerota archaeon]